MKSKIILQIIGTVTSMTLGIATIEILKLRKNLEEHSSFWSLTAFFVMMLTFYIMARTGLSYFKSRKKYEGVNYFLSIFFSILHFVSIPALFIMGLIIDFGNYWWLIFIGSIVLVAWSNRMEKRIALKGAEV